MSQKNSESKIKEAKEQLEAFVAYFSRQGYCPSLESVVLSIQVLLDDLGNNSLALSEKPVPRVESGAIIVNKETANLVGQLLEHYEDVTTCLSLKQSLEETLNTSDAISEKSKV